MYIYDTSGSETFPAAPPFVDGTVVKSSHFIIILIIVYFKWLNSSHCGKPFALQ